MKAFVRVLFILIFFNGSGGLAQEIEWQKNFGNSNWDFLRSIVITGDSGFIIGSDYYTQGNFSSDYMVTKFDENRNVVWSKTIGTSYDDELMTLKPTSDGGYILAGHSSSDSSGDKSQNCRGEYDYWIVKIDSLGNIMWDKTYGGDGFDWLPDIVETADGGFVCAGESWSNVSGDKTIPIIGGWDIWLLRLNSSGNIIWQKSLGTSGTDSFSKLMLDSLGNIFVGGIKGSSANSSQFSIYKLDASGNIIWWRMFGGQGTDSFTNFITTSDGGLLIGGGSNSNASGNKSEDSKGLMDYWILKLRPNGTMVWDKTIGGALNDVLSCIVPTVEGGFICGGYSESNISGDKSELSQGYKDYWIVGLDSSGNLIWQNSIGGSSWDELTSLISTNDNKLIIGGVSTSEFSGDKTSGNAGVGDCWFMQVKLDYNLINGKCFIDNSLDSTYTSGEQELAGLKITESTTGRFSFTNSYGNYSLAVFDTGLYHISPSYIIPYYSPNPLVHTASFNSILQRDSLNDFAHQPLGNFDDLCMTITPLGAFRPGFNGSYMLNYENVGTTTQSPRIVFRIFPNISFVSSSITPSAIYPDSVVWNLSSISPFQTGQILVTVNLSSAIPIGTILNSYAQIFPIVNDVNPSCNNATWEVTVTGSFDPNDISVDQDTLYSNVFPNPPFLDYLVRFQNTGTDTAFTVKILNPLDTMKLDLNSLEFVAASHTMEMRFIYHERNMEFLFNNILLPDSNVNEPASHGFVRYKIKPKSNLQVGDSIKNFAAIYFDFNEPVITNTAKTDILLFTGLADQISASKLFVYPNPSSQEINIQVSNTQGKRINLEVYNLFGQKVKSLFDGKIMSSELKQQFDISSLNQGLYLLQYNVDGVTKSKKIIKW
ncbi:MAG: T9SS type A sorting domain-containing protein [Bacteroidia bacterium]|nr:T9SS type A sorting domain-containing protein [Bacteroidia bacterium]